MRRFLIIVSKSVLLLVSAVAAALLLGVGYLLWRYDYSVTVPDLDKLAAAPSGRVCSASASQNYLALDEIPLLLRRTLILSEEPEFYARPSLNPFIEIAVGLAANHPPRLSGITMSVTRCLVALNPNYCKGDLECEVAFVLIMGKVARTFSRDRILGIYVNENYFGRGAHGVMAASKAYFGKQLDILGIDEIAFIAALPKAPGHLSKGGEIAIGRRNLVIDRMLQAGLITDADAAAARARPLELREQSPNQR